MTPCRRVLPLLEAFVDGELAADKVLEVDQHLAECSVCTERVRFSEALHKSTRRAVHEAAMPSPAFTERLQAALDAEYEREVRSEAALHDSRGKLLPWRVIVPVAAAASFSLFWAVQHQQSAGAGANGNLNESAAIGKDTLGSIAGVEQLVDELVNYHAKAAAPQVKEPSMLQELEPQVGVPVRLPSLQQYGARWEGASVVPMRNQRAASLRYNLGNHRVTLYVYDSNRFRLRATLEPRVVRNQPVYVGTRRGYSIAAREQRGLGYAIATDLDDRESAELVASIP